LSDIKSKIVDIIRRKGSCSFEELIAELRWSGDLRIVRSAIVALVYEGVIVREPDYGRRKIVYKLKHYG